MSNVKVKAIEPVNGRQIGEQFEVSESEAQQLVKKGLVKMQGPTSNKKRVEPENKANPSPAAGRARTSSASPVARASAKKTATRSARGARKPKAAG